MNQTELITLGAAELARRIRAREVTPSQVVEAHIRRIEAVNPTLNAVITPLFEQARAQAQAADTHIAQHGTDDLPPLFGVPVTIKDAFAVAGARHTAGSWFMRDHMARENAEAARRLQDAGAILLGKTNLPDMSWFPETENPVFGLTRNPWNPRRTVGGSSGGEAAIIAAGGSPLGLGSDIAGSVRLPAAMCGTVSLKPSAGRIPTAGHVPVAPPSLEGWNTVGPLARRVEDLALALSVLSQTPARDYRQIDLAGRRAVVYIHNGLIPVRPGVAEAVARAGGALAALGMEVVRDDSLPLLGTALSWLAVIQREGLAGMRGALVDGGLGEELRAWRDGLSALIGRGEQRVSLKALWVLSLIRLGLPLRALGFGRAERLARYKTRILEAMGPGGVVLCPVYFAAAPPHGLTFTPYGGPGYTMWGNALGLPGVVVPVAWTRDGLPLAVQVVAGPGEDETALAVAAQLERVFGGWKLALG